MYFPSIASCVLRTFKKALLLYNSSSETDIYKRHGAKTISMMIELNINDDCTIYTYSIQDCWLTHLPRLDSRNLHEYGSGCIRE